MVQTRRAFLTTAILGLASCATQPVDQTALGPIAAYLDGLHQFQARFTQTGAFGDASGTVWLNRPGRLRIAYDGPQPKTLVAANGRVIVYDASSGGTSSMPVSRTPLGILLAPQITLNGPITVTGYQVQQGVAQLTITRNNAPGDGYLTLYFAQAPLNLIGVLVVDAYQRPMMIHLLPLNLNPALMPDLFNDPSPPPPAG